MATGKRKIMPRTNEMMERREFMKLLVGAGGCAMAGGCFSPAAAKVPALAGDFAWGVLLHLGSNMWGDWKPDPAAVPVSAEEERRLFPDLSQRVRIQYYSWSRWRGGYRSEDFPS